jgi:hypothetical protein
MASPHIRIALEIAINSFVIDVGENFLYVVEILEMQMLVLL